ncbi:hypothetical protein POX_c03862 [Penicillium oxalicum]|uniref:hypothetical protein n=1 Tax=Penicillium oxalicum TaxID=69781 RepID=UPI0020B818EC|nr:hypothetical protein POX_c03862 [Penicillium oxalicum]KAI2791008.1 hypothetical protein POX_c03862 [Penicillium oxalicum]
MSSLSPTTGGSARKKRLVELATTPKTGGAKAFSSPSPPSWAIVDPRWAALPITRLKSNSEVTLDIRPLPKVRSLVLVAEHSVIYPPVNGVLRDV